MRLPGWHHFSSSGTSTHNFDIVGRWESLVRKNETPARIAVAIRMASGVRILCRARKRAASSVISQDSGMVAMWFALSRISRYC